MADQNVITRKRKQSSAPTMHVEILSLWAGAALGDGERYGEIHGLLPRRRHGLDYADQRYEQSGVGRFMTADPAASSAKVSDPGSWNRYAYVGGDPINYSDRTGLARDWAGGDDGCDGFTDDGSGDCWDGPSFGGGAHSIVIDWTNIARSSCDDGQWQGLFVSMGSCVRVEFAAVAACAAYAPACLLNVQDLMTACEDRLFAQALAAHNKAVAAARAAFQNTRNELGAAYIATVAACPKAPPAVLAACFARYTIGYLAAVYAAYSVEQTAIHNADVALEEAGVEAEEECAQDVIKSFS